MKKFLMALTATLFFGQAAFAVIMTEAPRNKVVAFKNQYKCTNGEWKQVIKQVTNQQGLNERQVGVRCVRDYKPGQKNSEAAE